MQAAENLSATVRRAKLEIERQGGMVRYIVQWWFFRNTDFILYQITRLKDIPSVEGIPAILFLLIGHVVHTALALSTDFC